MAASFVKSNQTSFEGQGSVSVTLTGVTAGNSLIAGASVYFAPNALNISSSPSLSWSKDTPNHAFEPAYGIFSTHNLSSGGNYTITATSVEGAYFVLGVSEFSGITPADSVDVVKPNGLSGGGSNSPNTGTSESTTVADAVVVAVMSHNGNSNSSINAPSGYTHISVEPNGAAYVNHSFDYRILSATGTQSASWGPLSNSAPWNTALVVYKAGPAGPPQPGTFTRTFSSAGAAQWTVPDDAGFNITIDKIQAWGAGGSGGRNSRATGGGGGAYSEIGSIVATAGQIVYINVGTGGAGRSTNGAGTAGGDSWARVGTNAAPTATTQGVLAKGGGAGRHGTSGTIAGAVGGAAASGVGTIRTSGGGSGTASTSSGAATTGGGGSATAGGNGSTSANRTTAGVTAGGAAGPGGAAAPSATAGTNGIANPAGGSGGTSSNATTTGATSGAGGAPGGGGGAKSASQSADRGADGQVIITYTRTAASTAVNASVPALTFNNATTIHVSGAATGQRAAIVPALTLVSQSSHDSGGVTAEAITQTISLNPQNPGTVNYNEEVPITVTTTGISTIQWVVMNGPPGYAWQHGAVTVATAGSVTIRPKFTASGQVVRVWDQSDASPEAYSGAVTVANIPVSATVPALELISSSVAEFGGVAATTGPNLTWNFSSSTKPTFDATKFYSFDNSGPTLAPVNANVDGFALVSQSAFVPGIFSGDRNAQPAGATLAASSVADFGAVVAQRFYSVPAKSLASQSFFVPGAVDAERNTGVPSLTLSASSVFDSGAVNAVRNAIPAGTTLAASIVVEFGAFNADQNATVNGLDYSAQSIAEYGAVSADQNATPAGFDVAASSVAEFGAFNADQNAAIIGIDKAAQSSLVGGDALADQNANVIGFSKTAQSFAEYGAVTSDSLEVNADAAGFDLAAQATLDAGLAGAVRHGAADGATMAAQAVFGVAGAVTADQNAQAAGASLVAQAAYVPGDAGTMGNAFAEGATLAASSVAVFGAASRTRSITIDPLSPGHVQHGTPVPTTITTTGLTRFSWVVVNPNFSWTGNATAVNTSGNPVVINPVYTAAGQFLLVYDTNDTGFTRNGNAVTVFYAASVAGAVLPAWTSINSGAANGEIYAIVSGDEFVSQSFFISGDAEADLGGIGAGTILVSRSEFIPGEAFGSRNTGVAGTDIVASSFAEFGEVNAYRNSDINGFDLSASSYVEFGSAIADRNFIADGIDKSAQIFAEFGGVGSYEDITVSGIDLSAQSSADYGGVVSQLSAIVSGAELNSNAFLIVGDTGSGQNSFSEGFALDSSSLIIAGAATARRIGSAAGMIAAASSAIEGGAVETVRNASPAGPTLAGTAAFTAGGAIGQQAGGGSGMLLDASATLETGTGTGQQYGLPAGFLAQANAIFIPGAIDRGYGVVIPPHDLVATTRFEPGLFSATGAAQKVEITLTHRHASNLGVAFLSPSATIGIRRKSEAEQASKETTSASVFMRNKTNAQIVFKGFKL